MLSGETEIGTERGITVIATSWCENETVSEATSVTTTPQCKLRKEYKLRKHYFSMFLIQLVDLWTIEILKQQYQMWVFAIYRKQFKQTKRYKIFHRQCWQNICSIRQCVVLRKIIHFVCYCQGIRGSGTTKNSTGNVDESVPFNNVFCLRKSDIFLTLINQL